MTLIDRGGLLVQAHWSENGALVITGQDLGDLPWEAHEYEYGITVRADALHLVAAALGAEEGDDLLAILAAQGEAIVTRGELSRLKELGTEPQFWSRTE